MHNLYIVAVNHQSNCETATYKLNDRIKCLWVYSGQDHHKLWHWKFSYHFSVFAWNRMLSLGFHLLHYTKTSSINNLGGNNYSTLQKDPGDRIYSGSQCYHFCFIFCYGLVSASYWNVSHLIMKWNPKNLQMDTPLGLNQEIH